MDIGVDKHSEIDGLRELVQKQAGEIKKLKYIAWALAEKLNSVDIESDDVLALRKELQGL